MSNLGDERNICGFLLSGVFGIAFPFPFRVETLSELVLSIVVFSNEWSEKRFRNLGENRSGDTTLEAIARVFTGVSEALLSTVGKPSETDSFG